MIRLCSLTDLDQIWTIINDGAEAYRGVIPEDRWHEPYMSRQELLAELANGVAFYGLQSEGALLAVMGKQDVQDVSLIRHAYARTSVQRMGLGSQLLKHLKSSTTRRLLVGTWTSATWAIRFYEKHGFQLVQADAKGSLLRRYWDVPERQIETSVVLSFGPAAVTPHVAGA